MRTQGGPCEASSVSWYSHPASLTLAEAERADTWREIEQELRRFEGPDGFVGPCEMLVGVAVK